MDQKYQLSNEYGSIIWDVEAILCYITKFKLKTFSVKKLANENKFNGNMQYAMTTDISKPLIIIQLNEIYDKLIDGNYRLQKCIKQGNAAVSGYYLTFEQHSKYIVDFDPVVYWNVVNHWSR